MLNAQTPEDKENLRVMLAGVAMHAILSRHREVAVADMNQTQGVIGDFVPPMVIGKYAVACAEATIAELEK